jgi:hypothetical protein
MAGRRDRLSTLPTAILALRLRKLVAESNPVIWGYSDRYAKRWVLEANEPSPWPSGPSRTTANT